MEKLLFGAAVCALAAAAMTFSTPAKAGTFSGFVDVTSHYVSRGTDQNVNGNPSLQGFGTYQTKDGYYGSVFASTMNFGDGTTKELDFFGGKRWTVGKNTIDVGFASINYPDNHTPWNFVEYDVKVDHPVGKGSVGAWVGYTQHYFNIFGTGVWTEVHGSYPLTDKITVSGAAANQYVPHGFDYRTWNADVSYAVTPTVSIDIRYSDTDEHKLDPVYGTYGRRISTTLTKSF